MPIKPACEMTEDQARVPLRLAAEMATEAEVPVTLVGVRSCGCAVYCSSGCCLESPGSVVLIPDAVMLELFANGWDEAKTSKLQRTDGKTVWIYKVSP